MDLTADSYVAYCIDQAIGYWGNSIEAAMDEVEDDDQQVALGKRKQVLHRFLHPESAEVPIKGRFMDPAMML